METVQVRSITGLEADRIKLRSTALRIIREILEKPMSDNRGTRRDWLAPPPLNSFSNLEPLGFYENADWWCFNPEECKPDLVWPINVGVVIHHNDNQRLSLSRLRTVSPKEVRGYATRFSPFMARFDCGELFDGKLQTAAGLFAWLGGQWVDAVVRSVWSGREGEERPEKYGLTTSRKEAMTPALLTSVALRQRYEWAVSLALPHSPSIRFATDPTGIKEMFRLREVPEGKDRREALTTWVTDHWRQNRADPDVELYVRKHLRGATKFEWSGLNCALLPSQYDVEKRDALIGEREAMRRAGIDRRKRK